MKKHCFGLLAFTLTSVAVLASANAADLNKAPEPYYKAPYYKAPPVYYPTWAGFYVGAHVGGAWSDVKVTDFDEFSGTKYTNKASGAIGGGTIGYNFQSGSFVYGAEIDIGVMGLSHFEVEPGTANNVNTILSKIGSGPYLDATGRFGYAFDKTLIYAKGGYAFYDGSLAVVDVIEAATKVSGLNGWTAGGGIEYKFAPAWSVKAEYQFFDFGNRRLVMPSDGDRYDSSLAIHTVKAGLNYHFNTADLNPVNPVYKAPPAAPLPSWTGVYIGANAGFGWSPFDDQMQNLFNPGKFNGLSPSGGFGGAQIGANWQWPVSPIVLGVEADFQGSAVTDSKIWSPGPGGFTMSTSELTDFGTVRGRIGYAFNNVLLYGTGGWAAGRVNNSQGGVGFFNISHDASGWVAGGGIEWAFAPRWSVKGEYQHIDLGANIPTSAGVPMTAFPGVIVHRDEFDTVRVGVNYKLW
jgi:outer membrane immunogenic protein